MFARMILALIFALEFHFVHSTSANNKAGIDDDYYSGSNLTEVYRNILIAKSLWQSQNIQDYYFEYDYSCFCQSCALYTKVVFVESTTIQSVKYKSDDDKRECADTTSGWDPLSIDNFKTIDGLFEQLIDNVETNAFEIRATYHSEYGYPIYVWIDSDAMMADEEFGYKINCLSATQYSDDTASLTRQQTDQCTGDLEQSGANVWEIFGWVLAAIVIFFGVVGSWMYHRHKQKKLQRHEALATATREITQQEKYSKMDESRSGDFDIDSGISGL